MEVDGELLADGAIGSARSTFGILVAKSSEHFVSGTSSVTMAYFSRTTRPKYHWRTPRLVGDVWKAFWGAMDGSSAW